MAQKGGQMVKEKTALFGHHFRTPFWSILDHFWDPRTLKKRPFAISRLNTETVCFSLFAKKVKNTFFTKKTGFAKISLSYSTLQPLIFCSKRVILGVFGVLPENPVRRTP